MNEMEILSRFVNEDGNAPVWTARPFVAESPEGDLFTVATDGHAIVRLRGVHMEPNYHPKHKPSIDVTKELPWDLLEQWRAPHSPVRRFRIRRDALGWLQKPGPEHHCPNCGEDLTTEECKFCSGTGVNPKDPDEDCPVCEGTKKHPLNTLDCPWCLATGWARAGAYWLVGREYTISVCELARILNTCGDIELMVGTDNTKPVGWRFNGGEGLLMPGRFSKQRKLLNG